MQVNVTGAFDTYPACGAAGGGDEHAEALVVLGAVDFCSIADLPLLAMPRLMREVTAFVARAGPMSVSGWE